MITSFYKLSATAHTLKYYVEDDGAGGTQVVPKADILNDCASGPLQSFLAGLASTPWQALALSPTGPNAEIDVLSMARGATGAFTGPAPSVEFSLSGPDQVMKLALPATDEGSAGVVTLRFNHSMVR